MGRWGARVLLLELFGHIPILVPISCATSSRGTAPPRNRPDRSPAGALGCVARPEEGVGLGDAAQGDR